jgi:hypothetical protein
MKSGKENKPANNIFETAVKETPEIANAYQQGLKAFGNYSHKIKLEKQANCQGSVEIDKAVEKLYPQENRWDYALCYAEKVYFVEIHSADTSEVSVVLKKFEWLKKWLREKAPLIERLKAEQPYFWVQSGHYDILKGSRQSKQIAAAGLRPIKELKLP